MSKFVVKHLIIVRSIALCFREYINRLSLSSNAAMTSRHVDTSKTRRKATLSPWSPSQVTRRLLLSSSKRIWLRKISEDIQHAALSLRTKWFQEGVQLCDPVTYRKKLIWTKKDYVRKQAFERMLFMEKATVANLRLQCAIQKSQSFSFV